MNFRALLLLLVLAVLALFSFLNWNAFITPTTLHFGFSEFSAPLGLIMLGFTAVLCCLFFIYIVMLQAGVIIESRRYAKELKAQRELADKAEASRFTDLRTFIETELRRLDPATSSAGAAQETRVALLEERVQTSLNDSSHALSAHLGVIEDKIDRLLPPGTR